MTPVDRPAAPASRYGDSVAALNHALRLMVEQGDTLIAASIAHPLFLAEVQLECERIDRNHGIDRDHTGLPGA